MAKAVHMDLDTLKKRRSRRNRAKIAKTKEGDIRGHMIGDGDLDTAQITKGPRPATVRLRLGMTQQKFSSVIGIPLATLRNWEQDRTEPAQAARALLLILAREPAAALRALGNKKAA